MDSRDSDRLAPPAPANGNMVGVRADSGATRADPPMAKPSERAGALGRQAWSRQAWFRQAVLIFGFLAAGVIVTFPRVLYLAGYVPASRDSASYVWGLWWTARQVTHLHNPWFTDHMAAPGGVPLGFHTLMPLPGVLMTPITEVLSPAVSYNLLVVALPGLLCYAMYRAARLWLGSATGAVAAGAFFGLSSMLTQQDWYHVNIAAGALFLPLALEASVRLRRNPGVRQAMILGLVMGVAVLTDQESAVLAAIVTGLTLGPWLLRRPSWAKARPAALAVAAGTLLASPQIIAMIAEIGVGGLSIGWHSLAVSYKQYGIGLPGMFSPSPRVADFGLRPLAGPFLHGRDNEGLPMFGTVLTVLTLLGLAGLAVRHSPSAPRCGSGGTSTCRSPRCGMGSGYHASCPTPGSSAFLGWRASARPTGSPSSGCSPPPCSPGLRWSGCGTTPSRSSPWWPCSGCSRPATRETRMWRGCRAVSPWWTGGLCGTTQARSWWTCRLACVVASPSMGCLSFHRRW